MSTPVGVREARILAEAYQGAPINWLRSYGRIDNKVRSRMLAAARQARLGLEAIPQAERSVTWYGAEQAVSGMHLASSGTDPRGGPEREQMISAMATIALEITRSLLRTDPDPDHP